ncbi:MAG: hypothetical protein HQ464_07080, partial [Planctomycetes bacterium]|nr:hypothetical protein [Planctomycetota bacterium]
TRDPGLGLKVDLLAEAVIIDLPVTKRRDDGDRKTSELFGSCAHQPTAFQQSFKTIIHRGRKTSVAV